MRQKVKEFNLDKRAKAPRRNGAGAKDTARRRNSRADVAVSIIQIKSAVPRRKIRQESNRTTSSDTKGVRLESIPEDVPLGREKFKKAALVDATRRQGKNHSEGRGLCKARRAISIRKETTEDCNMREGIVGQGNTRVTS